MGSVRSIIVKEASKLFLKSWNGKSKTINEQRTSMESLTKLIPVPKSFKVDKINADGVYAEELYNTEENNQCVILHLHGGAYTFGTLNSQHIFATTIAKQTKCKVILPKYRLAPEYPFPAALNDGIKVYQWLLSQGIDSSKIIISGDSAGGGLAVATVMALRDKGLPLPSGVVCLSPWVDLLATGESHKTNINVDFALNSMDLDKSAKFYAGEEDFKNPLISPVYGNFTGFPPMLIHVGTEEILLDDSIMLAEKAREDNVDVTIKIWEGMWHVWHLMGNIVPEGKEAIEEVCEFILKSLE